MHATDHFIFRNIYRDCLYSLLVKNRGFGQHCDEFAMTDKVKQNVGIIEFHANVKIAWITFKYLIKSITCLKSL